MAKLIAIQFFNLIWCVPLVIWIGYICFDPSVRKALEDTSTNNMEYMVVIIALTINWLIAPIGHLILTMGKKSQICDFYNANKERLTRYEIQMSSQNCQCRYTMYFLIALAETIALLLSLIWFMIVTTDYMQTYVLIYAVCGFLSIVKALLAYFYLRYILFLVDDLSNVWFPWFTSLQKRIGNESADQMLSNDTMDECYELIQACIQGTDLFSMQFYWWMIVQLLNATVVFTQLANMLFQILTANPEIAGEKWIYALFKGLISTGGFITSSLVIY